MQTASFPSSYLNTLSNLVHQDSFKSRQFKFNKLKDVGFIIAATTDIKNPGSLPIHEFFSSAKNAFMNIKIIQKALAETTVVIKRNGKVLTIYN